MFKKLFSAAMAVVLILGVSSAFAGDKAKAKGIAPMGEDRGIIIINGRVAKVDGDTVTVKDNSGREVTLKGQNTSGLKAGDTVNMKDGILEKSR